MYRSAMIGLCGFAMACTRYPETQPLPRPRQLLAHCVEDVRTLAADSIVLFPRMQPRPAESRMLRLSRTVPGGLLSIDQTADGRPLILMTDSTKADTLRAALAATFMADPQSGSASDIRTAVIRQVRFSYAGLVDWSNYLAAMLFSGKAGASVSGVGVNTRDMYVEVDVRSEADLVALESWATSASLPCGLVMVGISGPVSAGTEVRTYSRPRSRR